MNHHNTSQRLFFANLHLLSLKEQTKIKQVFGLQEKTAITEKQLREHLRLFSEKMPSSTPSLLWDNPGFFVAFIPKKKQCKTLWYTKNYHDTICLRSKNYWNKIVAYCETCLHQGKRPLLSLRKGYYSYGGGLFKKEEQYFSSLSSTAYRRLHQIALSDKDPLQRFYATLALHYEQDTLHVFTLLQKEVMSNDPEDQNTAGFFLLALGARRKVPLWVVLRLLQAEHQAPRTKGFYILAKYLREYSEQESRYKSQLEELAQWKTPLLRSYARRILRRLEQGV